MKTKFDVEQGNSYFNNESEEYEAIFTKVHAMKLTYDNLEDVAQWCGGYVANTAGNRYVAFPQDGFHSNDILTVHPEQYLVWNEDETFSRYLEKDLFAKYQKVENEATQKGAIQ